jgi:hypothetical protein
VSYSFGRFLSSGQSRPGSDLRAASVGFDDYLAGRAAAEIVFLLNRILLEKASNERGIEIRSNLNDRAIHKPTYPTVPVVEPHAILRSS